VLGLIRILNIIYFYQLKPIPELTNLPKDQLIPMPKRMPIKKRSSAHHDEDEDEEEQPQRKMTQTLRNGHKRDYFYKKTVKSIEELDKYRFEVMQEKI
jgi:hypothetical protein